MKHGLRSHRQKSAGGSIEGGLGLARHVARSGVSGARRLLDERGVHPRAVRVSLCPAAEHHRQPDARQAGDALRHRRRKVCCGSARRRHPHG